jgi:hypothetical protein
LQRLEGREDFVQNSRDKSVLHFRDKDELSLLVNAHEQRIEPTRSGNVTADDELPRFVRQYFSLFACCAGEKAQRIESLPFFSVAIPNDNTKWLRNR